MKRTDDAPPVGLPDVVERLSDEVKRLQKLVDAQAIVIRALAAEAPQPRPARPIGGDDVA